MRDSEIRLLKKKIDDATLISFDVFDTLLVRKVNEPETIFDLIGKHFGIHGFRKLRMDGQNEASLRVYQEYQYPHADIDEIYATLSAHTEIPVNWDEVKAFELQIEEDALVANQEMLEIFLYAKSLGKRVIAISDMYLFAETLQHILEKNGYIGFDYVYCSADEHKAKFNCDLFEEIARREKVSYERMLHIGDNASADIEIPAGFGINTYLYKTEADMEKIKKVSASDIDQGLYKILYREEKGFWYNLGVEVGGPLYMALYNWIVPKVKKCEGTFYFLSRDGYNLYSVLKKQGYQNIEYLYVSRRSLVLAGITEMNESDIDLLPPYTKGQTVGEIIDYLCVPRSSIEHLEVTGFQGFEDVIRTDEQVADFKKLYMLNRDVFLTRCELERKNAVAYLAKTGFLEESNSAFECGWNGTSQYLLERLKKVAGYRISTMFYYFGIRNTEKSRKQLQGLHYDTFLFDFYKNYALQFCVNEAVALYELFFSAPHESVYYYNESGMIFETGYVDVQKTRILEGILDYIVEGKEFVETYKVEYSLEMAVGRLQRLIRFPTEEEATQIGNLENVDEFVGSQYQRKCIAFITETQFENNPEIKPCWIKGLLRRKDVSDNIKKRMAKNYGIEYPEKTSEKYRLEDEQSLRNYNRWLEYYKEQREDRIELSYQPMFSVIIPVYNTVTEQLKECIDSVLDQTYENYELILVDDHSSWENVIPLLRTYEVHPKIRVIYREKNGNISVATNDGIAIAQGEFIAFMDCDDIIDPDALYEMAKKLNENSQLDFIYSDDNKITEDGKIRHMPFFKPDWSPDLFMCMMYTNHLGIYRTSIAKKIGGLRSAYNGSQDYDFTLRFMEKSDNHRVGHISKILYHWRERKESVAYAISSKNYAADAARDAKVDWIKRNHISAYLEYIPGMAQYRMIYGVTGQPLVSIIIPSKDSFSSLTQCIDSIYEYTAYKNYEIIVVDNGSDVSNKMKIEDYLQERGVVYIYNQFTFNFSQMCNIGARYAKGEYLLFLNDDIEIFQSEWLERMLGHAQLSHIGAVGAKLFYPQTTIIQHAGVGNLKDGPDHNFYRCNDEAACYFGLNYVDYNCSAVTGACLLVKSEKFWMTGGFDESFAVSYNDVELCYSLHELGYYNVVRNDVVLYHYESLNRGNDLIDDSKRMRLSQELERLYLKYSQFKRYDPYLNKNLCRYGQVLELSTRYDCIKIEKFVELIEGGNGNIDEIVVADDIRIIGWSYLEGSSTDAPERYLLFVDPFGNYYRATLQIMERKDVAEHFRDEKYLYSGFECILDKKKMRMDIMPYKIGILAYDHRGKGFIKWSDRSSNVIRNPRKRMFISSNKSKGTYKPCQQKKDVRWYIDYVQNKGVYYEIRGFAFCTGDSCFKYQQTLLLVDRNNEAYEFEVHIEERVDVATAFPGQYFLYNTGFKSYILRDVLVCGEEYEIVIRLVNQFDSSDVVDVLTDQRISN